MGDGTVRNRTTRSGDSRRPDPAKPRGAVQGGAASDRPTGPGRAPESRAVPTPSASPASASTDRERPGSGTGADRSTEQGLAVLPGDPLGDVRRQIRQPGP